MDVEEEGADLPKEAPGAVVGDEGALIKGNAVDVSERAR